MTLILLINLRHPFHFFSLFSILGFASGHTNGIIIDVNTTFRHCTGDHCYNTFVVASTTPEKPFALPGDIGSLVVDEKTNMAIGLIVAAQKSYWLPGQGVHDVVFCSRLKFVLQYLKERINKIDNI